MDQEELTEVADELVEEASEFFAFDLLARPDTPTWIYLETSSVPWIKPESTNANNQDNEPLCIVCRRINFPWLTQNPLSSLSDESSLVYLGSWARIAASSSAGCAFCRLVRYTVTQLYTEPEKTVMGAVTACALMNETPKLEGSAVNGYVMKVFCWHEREMPWDSTDVSWNRTRIRGLDTGIHVVKGPEDVPKCGRVVDERRVDLDLVRGWLRICDKEHPGVVTSPFDFLAPPSVLRLIDVNKNRLVERDFDARYVALSYVWGSAMQYLTVRANKAMLEATGLPMDANGITKTIRDTIHLVKELGIAYLWVDALCIVQDDQEEKINQIQAMGWIYKSAALTIVAADGKDADAGLPGVKNTKRNSRQSVETIGEFGYANRLPLFQNIADTTSVWRTRAWTYQERIFSRRLLLVTDRQAYLSCGHTVFAEDVPDEEGIENNEKALSGDKQKHGLYHHGGREDNYRLYCTFVESFTSRNIRTNNDIPLAFAGLTRVLEQRFRGLLCHGLPVTGLDFALLWHHDDYGDRRTVEVNGIIYPIYPSWSWMGWTGKVVHRITYPYENNIPRIIWDLDAVSQIGRSRRTKMLANDDADLPPSKRWERLGVDTVLNGWAPYVEADAPGVNFNWPIMPATAEQEEEMRARSDTNWLCFCTYSVSLWIDRAEVDEVINPDNHAHSDLCNRQPYDLKVYNPEHEVVGQVTVPRSVTDRLGGWHDFIVLTRTTLSNNIRDERYRRDVESPVSAEWDNDRKDAEAVLVPVANPNDSGEAESAHVSVASTGETDGASVSIAGANNNDTIDMNVLTLNPAEGDGPANAEASVEVPSEEGEVTEDRVGAAELSIGGFDAKVFSEEMQWPMYHVLLVERLQYDVAYRRGLGKIHITAFWRARPQFVHIVLG